jgi:1,4-alpha-glucan branching enzyme
MRVRKDVLQPNRVFSFASTQTGSWHVGSTDHRGDSVEPLVAYDVTDPAVINSELGGESAWREFITAIKAHGLKILLDIVPNHMSATSNNHWWDDVLTHGPYSTFAS